VEKMVYEFKLKNCQNIIKFTYDESSGSIEETNGKLSDIFKTANELSYFHSILETFMYVIKANKITSWKVSSEEEDE